MKYPWFKTFRSKTYYKEKLPNIIKSNKMTMGDYCKKLEKELKKILKVKYVVLTTSGTSALMMATLALGIKPGKKVICTNMTWIASVNPSLICGAQIHLVDTLPKSQKVCFKKLNNLIKKIKPDLVILVHLSGESVYNKEFEHLQKKMGFHVIEDAAQSFLVKNQFFSPQSSQFHTGNGQPQILSREIHHGCLSLIIPKNLFFGCSKKYSTLSAASIALLSNLSSL